MISIKSVKKMLSNYKITQDKLEKEKKMLDEAFLKDVITKYFEKEGIEIESYTITYIYPEKEEMAVWFYNEDSFVWGSTRVLKIFEEN